MNGKNDHTPEISVNRPGSPIVTAVTCFNSGRHDQAYAICTELLKQNPDNAEALGLLGAIAVQAGNLTAGIDLLNRAIVLQPDNPSLRTQLGKAYMRSGQYKNAGHHFQYAVKLNPGTASAHVFLANALQKEGDIKAAVNSYRYSLSLNQSFPDAWNNLGNALKKLGQRDEAVSCYQKALSCDSNFVHAKVNFALDLQEQGKLDEAVNLYSEVLETQPDNVKAHFQRAVCRLLSGDFKAGWQGYEWRFRYLEGAIADRGFSQPQWDGSESNGHRILVYTEQGLGDTFQFVRYISLLLERNFQVILECEHYLERILRSLPCAIDIVTKGGELPPFDTHTPLLSLPRIFATKMETIPSAVPYLSPEPGLVEHWAERFSIPEQFNVGICWQGSLSNQSDATRSVSVQHFAALADIPNVRLISLQKNEGQDQLSISDMETRIENLGAILDTGGDGFIDTAAVIHNLDLVVTVDTSVAHLAGALDCRVWVVLPFAPDWRWMLKREDSPWYPSMRLFRPPAFGDWDAVFKEVYVALAEAVSRKNIT